MTKYTDLEIIDLMENLDTLLMETYNASLQLTGYGEFLETFKTWDNSIQEKLDQTTNPEILAEFFANVETREADYFEISLN